MLRCLLCGAMCSGRPLISTLISVEHHKPFKERIANTHKLAIISLDFQHLSLFATVSGEVKRKGQREGGRESKQAETNSERTTKAAGLCSKLWRRGVKWPASSSILICNSYKLIRNKRERGGERNKNERNRRKRALTLESTRQTVHQTLPERTLPKRLSVTIKTKHSLMKMVNLICLNGSRTNGKNKRLLSALHWRLQFRSERIALGEFHSKLDGRGLKELKEVHSSWNSFGELRCNPLEEVHLEKFIRINAELQLPRMEARSALDIFATHKKGKKRSKFIYL